jgi:hypothetical protein
MAVVIPDMEVPVSCQWDCRLTDKIYCLATPSPMYLGDVGEFERAKNCPLQNAQTWKAPPDALHGAEETKQTWRYW